MTSTVYRSAKPSTPCPRCGDRLNPTAVHAAEVLACGGCDGMFLTREVVEALGRPENWELRSAFPMRVRAPEREVRYLKCPVCDCLMNRADFARPSRVIVDLCKGHGSWFDAGEINAVIAFVEAGGLETAQKLRQQEVGAEKARLNAQVRESHHAMVEVERRGFFHHDRLERHESPMEYPLLFEAMFSWLKK